MARVVLVDGKWMGEIVRSEACAKCGACAHGREERRYYPLPEGDWHEGDEVSISLPDRAVLSSALLAYGIPLSGLLIGLIAAAALGAAQMLQVVCALAGLGAGYVILRLMERSLRKSGMYNPSVPCRERKS